MILEELDEELDEELNEKVESNEEKIEQEEPQTEATKKVEEDYLNRLMRLQADFDNFRKRTIKEKDDIYKYALANFAEKLLPVMDNMERAIKAIEDANISDSYVDGVKLVSNQLTDVLKSEGLEEVETVNCEFDPQIHHGVAVEDVEEIENDQVIEVYQKGYRFNNKVIRPAMVKICKK